MNPKYKHGTPENRAFLMEIRNGLFQFGRGFASQGGSACYLGDDGSPVADRPRETYVTARMAHVYSLGTILGIPGSGELTDRALRGLTGELKDGEYGGWYSGIMPDGTHLPDKMCYAHAFVILAACSAMTAGRPGAAELLQEALSVYDKYFWNEEEGLSNDFWDTGFQVLSEYRGANANMHSVEAFLAAADTLHERKYRIRAGRMIRRFVGWAAANDWRIPEHYTKDWIPNKEFNREHPNDPFKPYGATPGHAIEWARLIVQWAISSWIEGTESRETKDTFIGYAEKLYRRAVADSWNADGAPGIVYTTDWNGKPVVHDRMHWTLAEAINTSAVLLKVTGKEEYAADYAAFMEYLDAFVLDHKNGSCYHQMDQNNRVIGTVWPGKPDIYHALQATLIPLNDPGISIVPALKGI